MELLAVFSPLVAFLIAGIFGKKIGDKGAQFVTCAGVIIAAFSSVILFFDVILNLDINNEAYTTILMTWIDSGDFKVKWALRIDQLSVVMMCVINIVSACVHVYSIGYMSHDPAKGRFMAYLSLFTFAMLMLVTADNLLQLFFGWEGVGLASYLLIGFWNHKHSANAAAQKAFIVNRVGDFGLALGIMATFVIFGSIEFETIFKDPAQYAHTMIHFMGYDFHALTVICLLLFMGAVGKSAQLGLHTWLPDAMEGPTPVSALIHAATMVTAGVFLIARFSPVFEYAPNALMVVTIFGALTAFVAATIGMTQYDIKRVIAYSTMSQLGYMFFALGVSAYSAAMFHLMTHAFFKALLFLGAGSVIHAMSDEQDMRNMGGIWKKIPLTYGLMWIGSLALAGIPPFAGFFSKDMVLEAAWADNSAVGTFAYIMGIAAAFMTAFYTWRMLLMTFHGQPRASKKVMSHIHESPMVMLLPLLVLATGAVLAGAVFYGGFVGSAHHNDGKISTALLLHDENAHEEIAEHKMEDVKSETEKHDTSEIQQPPENGAEAIVQKAEEIKDIVVEGTEQVDAFVKENAEEVGEAAGVVKAIISSEVKDVTEAPEGHVILWSRDFFWHDAIKVLPENDTVEAAHSVPEWVKHLPLLVGLLGIGGAYLAYMFYTGIPATVVRIFKPIHTLFFNKWFFDPIYDAVFVKTAIRLGGVFWRVGDKTMIDGFGPDGVAKVSSSFAKLLSRFQTGYVYQYALVMMIALVVIISWFVFKDQNLVQTFAQNSSAHVEGGNVL
ncbi:MAG: NADH-quinone oxidoreductase subunit L [Alphaproteobacteria bacterium]|nr:NADH-quinone oxidoreductase subunit L [Alphaproteobacteria bacterium]